MNTSALTTKTKFVEHEGRKLAYRSVGSGDPIVFCNRFRGTLDTWDHAFIDALASRHEVIWFSYSGMGRSGGHPADDIIEYARDVRSVALGLGLRKIIIGGWSFGGMVAQTVATAFPELVSHIVLIGTTPPGDNKHPSEKLFFERALKPVNDLGDEEVLFFEPRSESSRSAARLSHERIGARQENRDDPMTQAQWQFLLKASGTFKVDQDGSREKLKRATTPLLVISGDHDIVFPVENWHVLNREWPTLHLVTLPQSGHGPHHQFPELVAGYIATFVQTTR